MLIRYEFIDDNGVVLHTALGEVETQEDFISNEVIFREKFGYNENLYNAETHEIYDKCIKTEVKEILAFDPAEMLAKKMMSFM